MIKDNHPKVLIAVGSRQKIGASIFTLILKHACITRYEDSFKHGKKKKYQEHQKEKARMDDESIDEQQGAMFVSGIAEKQPPLMVWGP